MGGAETDVKERIHARERLALRNKVNEKEDTEVYEGFNGRDRKRKTYLFARPNGLRENAEAEFSCRGPGSAGNMKGVYQQADGGGRRRTELPL